MRNPYKSNLQVKTVTQSFGGGLPVGTKALIDESSGKTLAVLGVLPDEAIAQVISVLAEAWKVGHDEGYQVGHDDGYQVGHDDGYQVGHDDGYRAGIK